jgi:hypothetical protein
MEAKSSENLGRANGTVQTSTGESKKFALIFSKSAAIWVFVVIMAFALGLLLFLYVQGGLSHTVHQ